MVMRHAETEKKMFEGHGFGRNPTKTDIEAGQNTYLP